MLKKVISGCASCGMGLWQAALVVAVSLVLGAFGFDITGREDRTC